MQLAFYAALAIGSLIALSGPAGRSARTTAALPQPDSAMTYKGHSETGHFSAKKG